MSSRTLAPVAALLIVAVAVAAYLLARSGPAFIWPVAAVLIFVLAVGAGVSLRSGS